MDIAKIRKKAKEKEKEAAEKPLPQPLEEEVREKGGEDAGMPAEAASPEATPDSEMPVPDSVGETSEPVAAESSAEETGQAALQEKEETPPSEEVRGQEQILELLTFNLSKEEFAFRVSEVEEIIRHQRITTVPAMPDYVLGITSLRGKIIPVIDLKTRIIFRDGRRGEETPEKGPSPDKAKILILLGPKGPVGVTIDRVIGVVRLPQNEVLEPPAHLIDEERRFVDGVVVLDRRFVSIVRSEEALNIEVT